MTLNLDVTALTEVVVIGYGTQEKKELTSSVASIKSKDFNVGTVNDPAPYFKVKLLVLTLPKQVMTPTEPTTFDSGVSQALVLTRNPL